MVENRLSRGRPLLAVGVLGVLGVLGVIVTLLLFGVTSEDEDEHEDVRVMAKEPVTVVEPALREVGAKIYRIPPDDSGNVPFSTGIMGATSVYTSYGDVERLVYAGAAGCAYGLPDGSSCAPNADTSYRRIGMIWDLAFGIDGGEPLGDPPLLLPGTGAVSFARIAGDELLFSTESGRGGTYSLTTRHVTLEASPPRSR